MAELKAPHPLLTVTGASWPGVRYGCTTRAGGVSTGPWASMNLGEHVEDQPQAVLENRRRLRQGLPGEPCWLEQVHGTTVVEVVDTKYIYCAPEGHAIGHVPVSLATHRPQADAAVTCQPGVVLAIMTADCLPVVMSDTEGQVLGVAHAGWRGLAAGVLESTMAALRLRQPKAAGWRAWVGPAIGQARFEVGNEVRAAFVDRDPGAARFFLAGRQAGKWQADLAGLACHRLATMGVYGVEQAGLCTYDRDTLFYSYRRSAITGRMATLAWLESSSGV